MATACAPPSSCCARYCTASWAIFPLQSTMRCTAEGSSTEASSITCWNDPLSSSAKLERDAGARSSDLGVTTTSGRLGLILDCERNKWKYCAEVEGMATRRLPRALNERNRSKRDDECSGPWPS